MFAPRSRSPRVAALAAAMVIMLLVGLWFGGHPSWLPGPLRSAFVSQSSSDKLVNQVLGLLSKDYYRKVNRGQLTTTVVDKGLAAAVATLDDPYSHYYDPSDYHAFQNQDNPHLSGDRDRHQDRVAGPVRAGRVLRLAGGEGGPDDRRPDHPRRLDLAGQPLGGLLRGADQGQGRHRGGADRQARRPHAHGAGRARERDRPGRLRSRHQLQGDQARLRGADQLHPGIRRRGARRRSTRCAARARRRSSSTCARTAAGCSRRASTSPASSSPTARSSPPTGAPSPGRCTWPRAARSRPRSRSSCSSTTTPRRRPRSSPARSRTAAGPRSWARAPTARASFRRSSRWPTAARWTSPSASTSRPNGHNLGGGGVKRGGGITPNVYAYTNFDKPHSHSDPALEVAERTVAAELK